MIKKSILLVIVILSVLAGKASAHDLSPAEIERIVGGEVIINEVESPSGIPGVEAIFALKAGKKAALDTLTDYANFRKVFKDVDTLKVKSMRNGEAVVEFEITFLFLKISYTLLRRVDIDNGVLTWSKIDGDLDAVEGSWLFYEIPEKKVLIAVYTSYVKYGGMALTNVIRWRATQQTRNMCLAFKGYVEHHDSH